MAATTARSTSPSPTPTPSLLHNTSFTLTRLSPLYSLSPSRLSHYAHEFRDIVKGDILRGVRTTALPERPSASKSTLVRSCEWTLEADVLQGESFESLVVRVTWDDGGVFTAILVPDFTVPGTATATSLGKRKRVNTASGEAGSAGAGGFTSLPLMLSRGAPVVREQLINYLTTRFDCRASEVGLPSSLLQECLQGYLERCFTAADDDNDVSPRAIEKKIRVLEVMFTIPEVKTSKVKNALRKITISLPAQDVHELYRRYISPRSSTTVIPLLLLSRLLVSYRS